MLLLHFIYANIGHLTTSIYAAYDPYSVFLYRFLYIHLSTFKQHGNITLDCRIPTLLFYIIQLCFIS
jgi:hypothetical protein